MDTNALPLLKALAHTSPAQVTSEIALWTGSLLALAMALGRAWQAFKTGAGITSGVLKGTNGPIPPQPAAVNITPTIAPK
jgi:hypothetical protein